MNRYKNARDTLYELIEEHGYESPGPLLNELLQFLPCDQIEEFTEHLQHMGYLSTPDEEESEEEEDSE